MLRPSSSSPRRQGEVGGITILIALVMLSVVTVSAFSMGRSSLRDLMMTGSDATGRKAFETADSGLDYAITWIGYDPSYPTPPNATAQHLVNIFQTEGIGRTDDPANQFASFVNGQLVYSLNGDSIGGDLTPGTSGQLQTTSEVTPSIDLTITWLGRVNPYSTSDKSQYWLIRSTGRANVGTSYSFNSVREALVKQ
jgi:hypothetical protein